ncbi:VanZ family protein [Saccharothrix sp. NRRL B-16314]|uniref:VanZ family protein n=1 Tax=Saccharothrix sp. NRRL B-16314 TaxID=1463825 RepID=UPI0009DD19F8|nr:VanZ family protein [Saccharothrix sp. NRRL B-16314]
MSARQDVHVAELVLGQPEAVATLVAGSLVLGAVGFAVARWRRWPAIPAVLAGCGLALALAVTLARTGGTFTLVTVDPVGRCVGNGFSLAGSWERLNLLVLVPFAFFATVACRRPLPVFAVSALVSGGVELVQAATAIGVCEAQDFCNNTIGALVAAVVAWLFVGLIAPGRRGGGRPGGGRVSRPRRPVPPTPAAR